MSMRVGFVGIGNMGWPMAANLVAAGYDVVVCDAVPGRAEAFATDVGGHAGSDAAATAEAAEVVITILPTSDDVTAVVTEIIDVLQEGALLVEMSSGVPSITKSLAAELASRGAGLVDCPVSGGVARAVTGELAIMAGGDDDQIDRVEPLLRAMGTSLHRCGGVGSGQAMKALNNLVSAGGFLISIEALLIGQQFGLDPDRMVDVLNASTGMNNATLKKLKQFVLSRQFSSGFGLDLMVKDLAIALQIGHDSHTAAPFAALCRELWGSAAGLLGPGQDHTAVARFSEALAGVELVAPPRSIP